MKTPRKDKRLMKDLSSLFFVCFCYQQELIRYCIEVYYILITFLITILIITFVFVLFLTTED